MGSGLTVGGGGCKKFGKGFLGGADRWGDGRVCRCQIGVITSPRPHAVSHSSWSSWWSRWQIRVWGKFYQWIHSSDQSDDPVILSDRLMGILLALLFLPRSSTIHFCTGFKLKLSTPLPVPPIWALLKKHIFQRGFPRIYWTHIPSPFHWNHLFFGLKIFLLLLVLVYFLFHTVPDSIYCENSTNLFSLKENCHFH